MKRWDVKRWFTSGHTWTDEELDIVQNFINSKRPRRPGLIWDSRAERQEPSIPPWLYRSTAPYAVMAGCASGGAIEHHIFDNIDDAMQRFVKFHIGPMDNRNVSVLDGEQQMICGYSTWSEMVQWFGTEEGFAVFAQYHDMMSVALWEQQAKGLDGGVDVPKDIIQ